MFQFDLNMINIELQFIKIKKFYKLMYCIEITNFFDKRPMLYQNQN